MASLQQVVDGLRSLNKRNKELINIINEITGSVETTITKGVDALAEVIETKEPKLQEKTFEHNGTFEPDDGYNGFNIVTVNVIEDLSSISDLLGDDVEATKNDIETSVLDLIDLANTTTGNQDTNLTDGVNALVSGYGQGGSDVGKEKLTCFVSDTTATIGLVVSLKSEFTQHESGNIVLL